MSILGKATSEAAAQCADRKWHRIEFAFVDRSATARIDGRETGARLDIAAPTFARSGTGNPLTIRFKGVFGTIRNLRMGRDLHYIAIGRHGTAKSRLRPDEYYVLGDNSGNSEDSRFWTRPGVSAKSLLGKPILIHVPHRWQTLSLLGRSREMQIIDGSRFGWVR